MTELNKSLDRCFIAAIMNKKPLIIVEGVDDRKIYNNIAEAIRKNVTVMRVSDLQFVAGCNGVVDCMKVLQTQLDLDSSNLKFVLGIIDRDARFFKNAIEFQEIQNLKGIFILKHYSIETYFATRNSLKILLTKITNAIKSDIDDAILDFIEDNIGVYLETLYYISLDALKEHCLGKQLHNANYSYEKEPTNIVGEKIMLHFNSNILPNKKEDLDSFATSKSISFQDAKKIIKGKWYLYYYIYRSYAQIIQLKGFEKDAYDVEHYYNPSTSFEPIFKLNFDIESGKMPAYLYPLMLQCIDETELSDIIQKFRELS